MYGWYILVCIDVDMIDSAGLCWVNNIYSTFITCCVITIYILQTALILLKRPSLMSVEATSNLRAPPCAYSQRFYIKECAQHTLSQETTHTQRVERSHVLPLTDTYQRDTHKQGGRWVTQPTPRGKFPLLWNLNISLFTLILGWDRSVCLCMSVCVCDQTD